jgi:hypothetical protein
VKETLSSAQGIIFPSLSAKAIDIYQSIADLYSSSSENAQASGKKTIMPPDVVAALKDAEFEDFLPRLEAELKSTVLPKISPASQSRWAPITSLSELAFVD